MRKMGMMLMAAICMVLLWTSVASAALTNKDLQLASGLACINSDDTFFFSPTGESDEWGLYSLNTLSNGPITLVKDVKPARMLYADSKKVYFLAMKSNSEYLLGSVGIADGAQVNELDGIAGAFVESDTSILYVPSEDLYTLSRYDLKTNSSTKLKTMTSKTIYDACVIDGGVYFLGLDSGDKVVIYEINKKSGKAISLSNPNPSMGDGYLYDEYLIYHQRGDQTKVFSVPVGKSKGVLLGQQISGMSLSNPRFGAALYPYDSSKNSIVRVPLDGSSESTLTLSGEKLTNYLIGGTSEKIFYWDNGMIYSVDQMLQNKAEVVEFDITTDKMKWTYLSPTNQNYLLIMGYMPVTYADFGLSLPTAVRLVDLSTKETVFQYPNLSDESAEEEGITVDGTSAELIDTPQSVEYFEEADDDKDVSFSDFFGGDKK